MKKQLIDVNAIHYHKWSFFTEEIAYKEEIEQIPVEDAEEVVRCRSCKKWNPDTGACAEFTSRRLPTGGRIVFIMRGSDFCSYGERRDTE